MGVACTESGESVDGSTWSGVALGERSALLVGVVTMGRVLAGWFAIVGAFPAQPVRRLMINVLMKKCFRLSIGLFDYTSLSVGQFGMAGWFLTKAVQMGTTFQYCFAVRNLIRAFS